MSQLFDVYQHYQTNSKLELVILHFNILKCISDRIGAGTRYFRCLFFVQQHSEAAGRKGNGATLCRAVEVLHGRLKKKDSGSSKDADAVFSCCKVGVKEKNKHSDLTTELLKILSLGATGMNQERSSSLIAPIFSVN